MCKHICEQVLIRNVSTFLIASMNRSGILLLVFNLEFTYFQKCLGSVFPSQKLAFHIPVGIL